MIEELLNSKEFKTLEGETVKKQDQTVLDNIVKDLEIARKSPGFMLCLSYLYNEKGEERLRHNLHTVRFKDGDISIAMKEYIKLAEGEMQRRQLQKAPEGAVPAPVEENAPLKGEGKVEFDNSQNMDAGDEKSKKDEYRVEDDE